MEEDFISKQAYVLGVKWIVGSTERIYLLNVPHFRKTVYKRLFGKKEYISFCASIFDFHKFTFINSIHN